jgi:prepilin-type N-terminal cleavage/methylation domain-containing protein
MLMILRNPRYSQFRLRLGYTLAEVLFAVVILAVIACAFYAGLSSGFAIVQSTREDLRATQILTQKVEALRLCRWDQLTNFASFTFQDTYDPFGANSSGTVYSGTIITNAAAAIPDTAAYKANMRQLTVTISWTNFNGLQPLPHSRQMQTYVARYGLQNYIWGAGGP